MELNRALALIADPEELMSAITTRITEMFGADRVAVFRALSDRAELIPAFCSGWTLDELKGVQLVASDRLVKWLIINEAPLIVNKHTDVINYLSQAERDLLKRLGVDVCAPLLALNRLTGLLFLSSTDRSWRLAPEDVNLLQMVMSQASIAFENAHLYEQQRDRLRRLYRAERLAAAGQLAASVAHEIRNPLTAIRSTIQYLAGEFDQASRKRELVDGVMAEVDRIDRTLDELLSLTRSATLAFERIALIRLIHQTALLVGPQAESQSVSIRKSLSQSETYIIGDASQLKQVFLNLMLNAMQAMPGGGRLEIELAARHEAAGGGWACVSFIDTGCGIPAEDLDKIFDPFYTTKQGGTGLGLSISYTIIRNHGGEIDVESRPGAGTSLVVRLPLAT